MKRNLLFITILLSLMFILSSQKVSASATPTPVPKVTTSQNQISSLPENKYNYNYYLVHTDVNKQVIRFHWMKDAPVYLASDYKNDLYQLNYIVNTGHVDYQYNTETKEWKLYDDSTQRGAVFQTYSDIKFKLSDFVIATNAVIKDEKTNEVVYDAHPFRVSLSEIVATQQSPLYLVLEVLPMMVVCLVGYLGLRKALQVLQTVLHKA